MSTNLQFIKSTTISSNLVSTINITDVFSSDYDVYKIVSTAHIYNADKDIYMRYINSSGSVVSDSNYDTATLLLKSADAFLARPSSRENIDYGGYFNLTSGSAGGAAVEYVFNPADASSYTYGLNQSQGMYSSGTYGTKTIRILKQTTSITGINIYNGESSDNFGGGIVTVYGVR